MGYRCCSTFQPRNHLTRASPWWPFQSGYQKLPLFCGQSNTAEALPFDMGQKLCSASDARSGRVSILAASAVARLIDDSRD